MRARCSLQTVILLSVCYLSSLLTAFNACMFYCLTIRSDSCLIHGYVMLRSNTVSTGVFEAGTASSLAFIKTNLFRIARVLSQSGMHQSAIIEIILVVVTACRPTVVQAIV